MKKKHLPIQLIILFCFAVFFSYCNSSDKKVNAVPGQIVDINNITVNLPKTDGVELVERNCASCHSLRYIEIQPNLPKASWKKIVKKMVGSYGAPIKDTTVINQIIDYLVNVKGKK